MNKESIIIANWKMSLNIQESVDLVQAISKKQAGAKSQTEIVLCPSFTALQAVSNALRPKSASDLDSNIAAKFGTKLGAQDVFWEEKGAYTGEVSCLMLRELGCEYVIIGHSERRGYLNETEEMVHKKVRAALNLGLIPIICVGEKFEERQNSRKDQVVANQVASALEGILLPSAKRIIIAYEPVWVIGSGQAVEPKEAEYTNKIIKNILLEFYEADLVAKVFKTIYGGSIDSGNVAEFVGQENVDGVLVGGASLKAEEFLEIVKKVEDLSI